MDYSQTFKEIKEYITANLFYVFSDFNEDINYTPLMDYSMSVGEAYNHSKDTERCFYIETKVFCKDSNTSEIGNRLVLEHGYVLLIDTADEFKFKLSYKPNTPEQESNPKDDTIYLCYFERSEDLGAYLVARILNLKNQAMKLLNAH